MLWKLKTWIAITCLCFVSTNSWAALSSAMVWEVRSAGGSVNGCGFKSGATGTDYSQQNTAQVAYTDLVIDGVETAWLTSAANPFGAAHVGNILKVTGGTGFTTGFYEVASVSGTTATMDRAVGTASSTGGTGNLGGACSHPQDIAPSIVAGNLIHVKAATYVKQGANTYVLSLSIAGGNGTLIEWRGYQTTRNDYPASANAPDFDGATNTTNVLVGAVSNIFKNFLFRRASGDCLSNVGAYFYILNSRITACGDDGLAGSSVTVNTEVDTNTGAGLDASDADNHVMNNNYIHDNGAGGAISSNSSAGTSARNTIFDTNTGNGFHAQRVISFLINNVSYNNSGATADGYNIDGTTTAALFSAYNNISMSNGRYAFNRDATTNQQPAYFDYNIYNGHTTELNNVTAGPNDAGDVDPSFTNAAGGDFTFSVSTSPAVAAGLSQSIPGATGDYQWNIGVDQDDNTAGGGVTVGYSYGN